MKPNPYKLSYAAYTGNKKYIRCSKYKYVYIYSITDGYGDMYYRSHIRRFRWGKGFRTEREAAIAVDKYLISKGEEPINILVRK